MKRIMKSLKKDFVKKIAVVMLACVLLCSQSLAAAAATTTDDDSYHTCAFSLINRSLRIPSTTSTHTYKKTGYKVYPDGHTEPVVQTFTCTITYNHYKALWACACGNNAGYKYWDETAHSSCGK